MDVRGKRILLTGDSHMDWSGFGNSLERILKEKGADVTRLAIGATYAKQWLGNKDLCRPLMAGGSWRGIKYEAGKKNLKCINPSELETTGPYDLLVISTMGNDAATAKQDPKNNTPEIYLDRIRRIASRVGAPNFLLVGSPYYGPTKMGHIPFVEAATAAFGDNFHNSIAVTQPYWGKPGEGDRVHYTGTGGRKWGESVVKWIEDHNLTVPFPITAVRPSSEPAVPALIVSEGVIEESSNLTSWLFLLAGLGLFAYVYKRRSRK